MMNRIPILCLLPGLLVGCHVVLGPDDGYQEWWYYCDAFQCYRCNADYCEFEDQTPCYSDSECPPNMYCDPTGTCRTKDKTCKISKDCGSDYICSDGKCVPSRGPCTDDDSCGSGAYCSDGVCKDTGLCTTDHDCTQYGDNFECDERGTCVPGPPYQSCSSGTTCPDGFCVDAKCGACSGDCGGGRTCQFAAHCGEGRACLDGRCTVKCTGDSDCGTGQVCKGQVCVFKSGTCVNNTDCGTGKICVNNTCHEDCTTSNACTSGADVCSPTITTGETSVEICIADTSATLECTINKDCEGGELCVNGVCRTSCTKTEDCAACDDGPVCGPGGFCMTSIEADPQCSTNADCSGQVCLDAQCVTL